MLYYVAYFVLKPFFWLFCRIRKKENLPQNLDRGLIVVANHITCFDPLAISIMMPIKNPIKFMAKSELWNIPLMATFMKNVFAIPVERKTVRSKINVAAIKKAINILRDGGIFGIFLEGGIDQNQKVRRTPVFIAKKVPVYLLPVCIERKYFLLQITIGKILTLDGFLKNDEQETADMIYEKINDLKRR